MERFKDVYLVPNAIIIDAEHHDEYVKLVSRKTLMDVISSMTSQKQEYMIMYEVSEEPRQEYDATEISIYAQLKKTVRCGECDFGYSGRCLKFGIPVSRYTYCAWGTALDDDANKTDIHGNHDGRV